MLHVLLAAVLVAPGAPLCVDPVADPALLIEVCDAGGWRAETCAVTCHRVFNYWTTSCNVSCRSGYYACCSCDSGCHCVMDHDEMWPPPSDPTPQPDPDPPPLD